MKTIDYSGEDLEVLMRRWKAISDKHDSIQLTTGGEIQFYRDIDLKPSIKIFLSSGEYSEDVIENNSWSFCILGNPQVCLPINPKEVPVDPEEFYWRFHYYGDQSVINGPRRGQRQQCKLMAQRYRERIIGLWRDFLSILGAPPEIEDQHLTSGFEE
jgi:hypothetical protein